MLKLNHRKFSTSTIAVAAPVKEGKENGRKSKKISQYSLYRQGKDNKTLETGSNPDRIPPPWLCLSPRRGGS